jgi:thiol:disulfide interchange protein
LSGKYKAMILIIVVLAAAALLLMPQQEKAEEGPAAPEQTEEPQSESFTSTGPSQNPYQEYLAARQKNKPILLEFYARW